MSMIEGCSVWYDTDAIAGAIMEGYTFARTLRPEFDPTSDAFHTDAAFNVRVSHWNRTARQTRPPPVVR
jgi:hypothetical protein